MKNFIFLMLALFFAPVCLAFAVENEEKNFDEFILELHINRLKEQLHDDDFKKIIKIFLGNKPNDFLIYFKKTIRNNHDELYEIVEQITDELIAPQLDGKINAIYVAHGAKGFIELALSEELGDQAQYYLGTTLFMQSDEITRSYIDLYNNLTHNDTIELEPIPNAELKYLTIDQIKEISQLLHMRFDE